MTSSTTATTHGARDHARAQAGQRAEFQPIIPPSAADDRPDGVAPADMLWEETIEPGNYGVRVLPRGANLRLIDVAGDTCAQLLVFNAAATAERLNLPDTVKIQWQAYLGEGALLLSDMGRVLASVRRDTSAGHDLFNAMSNRARNEARYGGRFGASPPGDGASPPVDGGGPPGDSGRPGAGAVHGAAPNARDRFAVALAKFGLDRRDIGPAANLFKKVIVEPDGTFAWHGDASPAGGEVVLRCEMDVLVAITVTPHVLDPRPAYTVTPLRVTAWRGPVTDPDDPVRRSTPERERAFENTDDWYLGRDRLAVPA